MSGEARPKRKLTAEMLAQAHHLADEKRAIDESRDRLKAMKLDLHNRVANYNRLVNKFEANKKEPSAYEAVKVEPPVPLRPLKQAEEVSALEAKVAELQQQLANSKASASLNISSEAAGEKLESRNGQDPGEKRKEGHQSGPAREEPLSDSTGQNETTA